MAGILYAGDGAVLGGGTAARAWGIHQGSGPVEIMREQGPRKSVRGCRPHHRSEFLFRRGSLEGADYARIGPTPVMDPARVLIDLAGKTTEAQLRRYFIEAGREGLLTPGCLNRIDQRSRGFNGRSQLLILLSNWGPSTGKIRSVLEGEFRLMRAEQKLPPPLFNQRVGEYEVDVLWKEARVIVELDGRKFHNDAFAMNQDSKKTKDLRRMGYRVLRFTWNDVVERPAWVAEQIRRELG